MFAPCTNLGWHCQRTHDFCDALLCHGEPVCLLFLAAFLEGPEFPLVLLGHLQRVVQVDVARLRLVVDVLDGVGLFPVLGVHLYPRLVGEGLLCRRGIQPISNGEKPAFAQFPN